MKFSDFWRPVSVNGFQVPLFFEFIRYHDTEFKLAYPLKTEKDHARIMAWWICHGFKDFPGITNVHLHEDILSTFDTDVQLSNGLKLPSILWGIWNVRDDLRQAYDLENNLEDAIDFVVWFGVHFEQFDLRCWSLLNRTTPEFQTALLQYSTSTPRFLISLKKLRPDLSNLSSNELTRWWNEYGENEHPVVNFLICKNSFLPPFQDNSRLRTCASNNGITLVGFPRGIFGIGEDIRQLSKALELAGIPHDIVEPSISLGTSNLDSTVQDKIVPQGEYETVIFCLPPADLTLAIARGGNKWLGNRLIAYTQWEYAVVPRPLQVFSSEFDQVWTISSYAKEALEKSLKRNVEVLSNTISLPPEIKNLNAQIDSKFDSFQFLTNFDFNSTIPRKNPIATIEAFLFAFQNNENVRLVIKTINHTQNLQAFDELREKIKNDNRIQLITDSLSRTENLRLLQSSQAFVSLHRAEGFGRNIAEAMLVGVPVVTTGFSGNMDFCDDQNSYLVKYSLIESTKQGESLGTWAEPSISDAAQKLREAFQNKELRLSKIKLAREKISSQFNVSNQVEKIRQLLPKI